METSPTSAAVYQSAQANRVKVQEYLIRGNPALTLLRSRLFGSDGEKSRCHILGVDVPVVDPRKNNLLSRSTQGINCFCCSSVSNESRP